MRNEARVAWEWRVAGTALVVLGLIGGLAVDSFMRPRYTGVSVERYANLVAWEAKNGYRVGIGPDGGYWVQASDLGRQDPAAWGGSMVAGRFQPVGAGAVEFGGTEKWNAMTVQVAGCTPKRVVVERVGIDEAGKPVADVRVYETLCSAVAKLYWEWLEVKREVAGVGRQLAKMVTTPVR